MGGISRRGLGWTFEVLHIGTALRAARARCTPRIVHRIGLIK